MKRRDVLATLGTAVGIATVGCFGSTPGGDDSAWRHLQYDAGHSGYSPAEGGPDGGAKIHWWSETWGRQTSPVVAGGTVYAGSGLRNEAVVALDTETGDPQWQAPIGDEIQRALAIVDGTLYVGAGGVYALDADTGQQEWYESRDTTRGLTVADGTVYTAQRGGSPTIALAAENGEERWSRDVHALATPAVHDGRVFVGGTDGLVALDAKTGDTDWSTSIDHALRPPTARNGRVYAATRKQVVAFDAATGDEQWSRTGRFHASDLAVTDETLYLTGQQREGEDRIARVLAVDTATGTRQWTLDESELHSGSAVVAGDVLYVSGRNRLDAIDTADGERLWWLRFQWPLGPPTVVDGTIFISVGGRLQAIGAGNGRNGIWDADAEPVPNRSTAPPDPTYASSDFTFGTDGYDVEAHADATVDEDAPVEATLTIDGDTIDADEAVTITVAVTNESDDELVMPTGAPEPFGVVRLQRSDRSLIAWTPAYEKSAYVGTSPQWGITGVADIGLQVTIPPGETLSETYTLSDETHGIQPGSYEFARTYTVRPSDSEANVDGWTFDVNARVELTKAGPESGATIHDLAIADEVALPDDFIGRFSVEVLEPVTEAHPGLIEIALANDSDERGLMASMRHWPFGSYIGLGPGGKRLVLLGEGMYAPGHVVREGNGWWRPAFLPSDHLRRGKSTTGFDPGETRSQRYVVVAHPETDGPEATDSYSFEQGFADDNTEVTWGFALSVLDPNG